VAVPVSVRVASPADAGSSVQLIGMTFTQSEIDRAMTEVEEVKNNNTWAAQDCFDYETNYGIVDSAASTAALQYLALVAHQQPLAKSSGNELVANRVATCIHHFLSAGKDPLLYGIYGWSEPLAVSTLALAKQTPAVWLLVSLDDKTRADWFMKTAAVVGNFEHNAAHSCKLDIPLERLGGFLPNQRGYPAVMSYVYMYFGDAAQVNASLASFNFDDYIARFNEFGWTRNKDLWTRNTATRQLMEGSLTTYSAAGGSCTVTSQGVRRPFTFRGTIVGDPNTGARTTPGTTVPYSPFDIFKREEAGFMYGNKVVNTSTVAYTGADCLGQFGHLVGSASQYTGQLGMAYEFSTNPEGRSSLHYVWAGQRIALPHYATIVALGYWPATADGDAVRAQIRRANEHIYFEAGAQGWYGADSQGRCGQTLTEQSFTTWRSGYSYGKDIYISALR
jgi:hypothetical protein